MESSEKPGEASLQPKSPEHAPMDVSEDEQDEALLKLNEDELRILQNVDSIQCIEGMRIHPKEASRFDIPLCRMVYMPVVHPTLAYDIKRLEAEFTYGYRPGAPVFYVSICNLDGEELSVKDVDTSNWGPHCLNLRPSWLQTLTLSSSVVRCFLYAMGTTSSRHG
jgi:hypothetical protein